ncbi:MAG: division/cell wall cluster transcriptional repressor MraZ [Paracoccaceae bacterium]|nr:MAG: division/cell wall cluster transcriptional repressor MraZ [Paracoccaceae bacterium]
MSEAFRGEYTPTLDAKARVQIPAFFRKVIVAGDPGHAEQGRARFVIVYGDARRSYCECFTIRDMRKLEKRIGRMPSGSAPRRLMERNYISMSHEVEIDDEGRIVLPPACREKIGLGGAKDGGKLMLAGMLDKFHLWKLEDYLADPSLNRIPDEILPEGEDMLSLLPPDDEEED